MVSRFWNKLLYGINIVVGIAFVLSLIMPYISLKLIPILSVLSLGIPLLFIVNSLFVIYWIWKTKKHFILSLSLILIGLLVFDSFYQFESQTTIVPAHSIDVMSYNTHLFNKYHWKDQDNIPEQILTFIDQHDPQVLCLQEFDMNYKDAFTSYPYHAFSEEHNKSVQAIFSKYPIINAQTINFEASSNAALFADLKVANYTLRVFNIHLQSLGVSSDPELISNQEPQRLLKRMSSMFSKQEDQAQLIRAKLDESPYYNIVAGDFNNTQYSRVYRLIKGDMNDSFIQRGSGFGRSFDFKLFPMRIDFILSDKHLEVVRHQNFKVSYSDHYPLMSTLNL